MDDASHDLIPNPSRDTLAPSPDRRALTTILWSVLAVSSVTPLARPGVPEDMEELPSLLRIHACLRLFLVDMEYALSPSGHLRGLCRWVCRISIILTLLALCLAGVLTGIALVLAIVAIITQQLVVILFQLLEAALLALALLVLAAGFALVASWFSTSSSQRRSGWTNRGARRR